MTMHSSPVFVSCYRPDNRRPSIVLMEELCHRTESCFRARPWQPFITGPQDQTRVHTPSVASLSSIREVMDQYLQVVFRFTHPHNVDFRDLHTGELAGTDNSVMVSEHGQRLWMLLNALQSMCVAPDEVATLEQSIRTIQMELENLEDWVEAQRRKQLLEESTAMVL